MNIFSKYLICKEMRLSSHVALMPRFDSPD